MGKAPAALDALQRKRDAAFLAGVGIALRYGATKGLPLASLYQAFVGANPEILFRFLSKDEIEAAMGRLAARGTVTLEGTGRDRIALAPAR